MKIDGLEWNPIDGTLNLIVGAQRYIFLRNEAGDLHYSTNCAECGQPLEGFYRQGAKLALLRRCQVHKQPGVRVSKAA